MKKNLFLLLSIIIPIHGSISFSYLTDGYATHQPIIYAVAMNTKGPIIEFGCGNGSTDLLHEICKKENRLLISLDDNLEWLNKFKQKYINDGYKQDNSGWHKFYFVDGKKDNENPDHWINFLENNIWLKKIKFDLCFIDQSPWLARYETLKRFKQHTRYIVIHDVDYFPGFNIFGKVIKKGDMENVIPIFDFSDTFHYSKVYFPAEQDPKHHGPPTLLASDIESEFPYIEFNLY